MSKCPVKIVPLCYDTKSGSSHFYVENQEAANAIRVRKTSPESGERLEWNPLHYSASTSLNHHLVKDPVSFED